MLPPAVTICHCHCWVTMGVTAFLCTPRPRNFFLNGHHFLSTPYAYHICHFITPLNN